MSGHQDDATSHAPPAVTHKYELPASIVVKLKPEELDKLETWANNPANHENLHHIAALERAMAAGASFEQALKDTPLSGSMGSSGAGEGGQGSANK